MNHLACRMVVACLFVQISPCLFKANAINFNIMLLYSGISKSINRSSGHVLLSVEHLD